MVLRRISCWKTAGTAKIRLIRTANGFPELTRPLRKDNTSHVNFRKSDFWITNVRYIRLRNIEFGYSFDQKIFKKLGLSALRIYVNASNLFSIDNVKKYEIDPEISSGNALVYPQQRLFQCRF